MFARVLFNVNVIRAKHRKAALEGGMAIILTVFVGGALFLYVRYYRNGTPQRVALIELSSSLSLEDDDEDGAAASEAGGMSPSSPTGGSDRKMPRILPLGGSPAVLSSTPSHGSEEKGHAGGAPRELAPLLSPASASVSPDGTPGRGENNEPVEVRPSADDSF